MNPVKVMIVDDEILAIEHISGLVPWQRLGYEIVCTATRPVQAFELAQRHRPELVIVDIVMPGMDGLELSRKLAELGFIEHIVLLTSYKEFDYAKEAVKLGLTNYWVKHEMDAGTLMTELGGLRQEIVQARRKREHDRDRLLMDWLGGRQITDEQWEIIRSGVSEAACDRLHMAVLQADRPYPLLSGIVPAALQTRSAAEESAIPATWPDDGGGERLAAIRLPDGPFILIYPGGGSVGEAKMRAYLEERAVWARQSLEQAAGCTVSMALVYGLQGREELPGRAADALRLLAQSFYEGPRHIYRLNDAAQPPASAAWVEDDGIERFRQALSALQIEEAMGELPLLFEQAAASRDEAGFSDMCRQLASALNRCRVAAQLPTLAELWEAGELDDSGWTSIDGIRSWFMDQLQGIAAALGGQQTASRKIRLALSHMEQHYDDPDLDTDAIARQVGLSRDHFRHLFKEETGQTVLDRLTDIRMKHAKRLLDEGRYKVYEIAEKVGFRNSQYFSQVFRKSTGMNPLEYMERTR